MVIVIGYWELSNALNKMAAQNLHFSGLLCDFVLLSLSTGYTDFDETFLFNACIKRWKAAYHTSVVNKMLDVQTHDFVGFLGLLTQLQRGAIML